MYSLYILWLISSLCSPLPFHESPFQGSAVQLYVIFFLDDESGISFIRLTNKILCKGNWKMQTCILALIKYHSRPILLKICYDWSSRSMQSHRACKKRTTRSQRTCKYGNKGAKSTCMPSTEFLHGMIIVVSDENVKSAILANDSNLKQKSREGLQGMPLSSFASSVYSPKWIPNF